MERLSQRSLCGATLGFPAVSFKGAHSFPRLGSAPCQGSFWGFLTQRLSQAGPPRTEELEKCAENLGATRGRGRGHSPPPSRSQWRASSVIPSLTWGGKWAGPVCWEGPASPFVPAQNGVLLPCTWKWTEEAGKVPFILPHHLPLGCKSSN